MRQRNKEKGFTLVELLATIFIISTIMSIAAYSIINTINNSKDTTEELTYENLMTGARIYVEENPNKVIWSDSEDKLDEQFSCISVKTLINQNIIKKDSLVDKKTPKYIIVTKNKNTGSIISEKEDTGICKNTQSVKIPTSKEYCNKNLEYNQNNQRLTIELFDTMFQFKDEEIYQKDAGTYKINAYLSKNEYTWEDGTTEPKTITCTIKKAIPELILEPSGTDINTIEIGSPIISNLTSSVPGTITIKSSNNDYSIATSEENKILAGNENKTQITITPLATRNTKTIITITLTPEDTKNYYSKSTPFIIGQSQNTKIDVPTPEQICSYPNYTGTEQSIIKTNIDTTGYKFDTTTIRKTDVGTYKVIAILKYGYIWNDEKNPTGKQEIECAIKEKEAKVTYETNGGTTCNPIEKKVTYLDNYGTLCIPQKDNYMFLGWYTQPQEIGGNKITEDSTVATKEDHTLYAHWKEISCTITYSGTLGINNWYTSTGNVNLITPNMTSEEIKETNITTSSQTTFTKPTSTIQEETSGTTWYGYVKDINDNVVSCKKTIKVDSTPPEITSLTNPSKENWTNKSFTLTTEAKEELSGIKNWQYKYNETDWTIYDSSNTKTFETTNFTKERNELVYLRTCDNAGNCSTESSTYIRIDTTKPTIPKINNPTNGDWVNYSFALTTSTSDNLSGIKNWQYKYSGNWITYSNSNSDTFKTSNFVDNQERLVYLRSCDNAGNCSTESSTYIKIDKIAPTTPTITNPTNGNWVNYSFALTTSTTDNLSGIKNWQYKYSDDNWITYSSSNSDTFKTSNFSSERNEPVYLRSCDNAGNCSTENSTYIRIDKTKPTTPVINNKNNNTWVNTPYSITATTTETGSGIEKWLTREDDATQKSTHTTSSTTFTSNELNNADVEYKVQACDIAGNCSEESITNIKVDTIAPVITSLVNPTNETWTNQPFPLTVKATEEQSGIAYWQYKYAATDWKSYDNSAKTAFVTTDYSAERNELTYIRVCDNVGNCSEEKNTWIKIDKTAPEIPTITKSKEELPTTPPLYLDVSSHDNLSSISSGINLWYYKYDNPLPTDSTDWTPYPNSQGQTTFTTSGFSALRNDYVNIRVCDVAGNCSQNKTQIYLTSCSENNPTACKQLYLCKFGSSDADAKPTQTYIRSTPAYIGTNTIGDILTGERVYAISETDGYYKVYVQKNDNVVFYNNTTSSSIIGYIDADCLRDTKLSVPDATCQSECRG